MRTRHGILSLIFVLLCLISPRELVWISSSLSLADAAASPSPTATNKRGLRWRWFRSFGRRRGDHTPKVMKQKRKWSSMFTVDPSAILSTLLKAGGIFIPKSSQKDIEILKECLHCQRAEMNVVQKTMILYNSTIGLDGEEPALLIGRTYVHWDSYTKPTIYIEVDDVELLVDFYNVLLTKSNWQAIRKRGFPPEIAVAPSDSGPAPNSKSVDLVRVGSIDLSGAARIRITSRALEKQLGIMELDMDSFDDFTALMQEASECNWREHGRRGLTSDEVATMLQNYFAKKIRSYVLSNAGDIVANSRGVYEDARGIVEKTANSVLDYAVDASRKTGVELQAKVTARLGISTNKLDRWKASLQNVNKTAVVEALQHHQDVLNRSIVTAIWSRYDPQFPGH